MCSDQRSSKNIRMSLCKPEKLRQGSVHKGSRQDFGVQNNAATTAVSDVFTKSERSRIMARVLGRGNARTELVFVKILRQHKIVGWRRHRPLFGSPDFVFSKKRVAIFVDGCFWHGCPRHGTQPSTNRAFWRKKLVRNKDRDRLVTRTLQKSGWYVLRIWQHELVCKRKGRCLLRIKRALGHSPF